MKNGKLNSVLAVGLIGGLLLGAPVKLQAAGNGPQHAHQGPPPGPPPDDDGGPPPGPPQGPPPGDDDGPPPPPPGQDGPVSSNAKKAGSSASKAKPGSSSKPKGPCPGNDGGPPPGN